MKFPSRFLFGVLMGFFLIGILLSVGASKATALTAVGILFLVAQFAGPLPQGVARNEVLSRMFSRDVQKKLFPNNSFYKGCYFDAGVAEDQESVEIPQDEDGAADVVVNPTVFPLPLYTEEDKKKTYAVDLLATRPQLVTDLNQALVSYDKRMAKMEKHINSINTKIADRIYYHWAPTQASFIRRSTGTENRPTDAIGGAGLRKRLTFDDWLWAFTLFNGLNIPLEGRRCCIPPNAYSDLLKIDQFIDVQKLRARGEDVNDGVIGRILTFDVYMRSRTHSYTNDATPVKKALGAATAADDNASTLFYHTRFVRYAEGQNKTYINLDQGQNLGSTANIKVRSGGTASRLSEIGVAVIVEAATA